MLRDGPVFPATHRGVRRAIFLACTFSVARQGQKCVGERLGGNRSLGGTGRFAGGFRLVGGNQSLEFGAGTPGVLVSLLHHIIDNLAHLRARANLLDALDPALAKGEPVVIHGAAAAEHLLIFLRMACACSGMARVRECALLIASIRVTSAFMREGEAL